MRHKKKRLTLQHCRRQTNEVVVENFEAAQNVLRYHKAGNDVKPEVLAEARVQLQICRQVLLKRGFDKDALDYEPEEMPKAEALIPVGETISEPTGGIEVGGSADTSG